MVAPNVKQLDWLLDDLVRRLVGAEKAVVLSQDGLPIGHSASAKACNSLRNRCW